MPIALMVQEKKFRQDLLYRINTVEIHLPPLRDRMDDIPLLVQHFLGKYGLRYHKPHIEVPRATMNKLQQYNWPGNVRELEHAVERALILSEDNILQPEDFFLTSTDANEDSSLKVEPKLQEIEKGVIQKALAKHGGNVTQTAKELGLTRTALYRRFEKYGL